MVSRGEKRECTLTSVGHNDGSLRHVCNFSSDHHSIKLFSELSIEVLEAISNHTTCTQKLLVETVGLIAPPTNVTAEWLGVAQQLRVMWIPPPIAYADFLAYEVLYHIEGSRDPPLRFEVKESHICYLNDLLPGQKYHIRVRTKPDGTSLDGFWGPWSPEVLAEIPHQPDLHHVLDGVLEDNGKQQQQVNPFFCNKTLEDVPLTCLLEVLSERPVETQSYGPLLESISEIQTDWDSQPSSCQHYMVLSSSSPQGSRHENEYFDDTGDGHDTLPHTLAQDPQITSDPKIQLSSFTLLNTSLGAPEIKEERSWETSENHRTTSATHVSNQSYLLMA
ncbi:hypothetical protein JD844_018155 [Phrynosoma platyrhinos]|uniref:Fibronectin type-III domain-containing protein n=1 Tax=Phrynosoma platyrhinos TaxID=52577 RepID=A0ABQ7SMX8_PHRPL|nr:hypothetical protein JD844_018155 [Phrynosoma platyrhinos]